ncbi:Uncharacterised protein [Mycobacteroides abscessus subsp. abscessus]|nr:Uncharacterised protein [Mycobacteroides abscessus subsp. abscessus]
MSSACAAAGKLSAQAQAMADAMSSWRTVMKTPRHVRAAYRSLGRLQGFSGRLLRPWPRPLLPKYLSKPRSVRTMG